MSSVCAPASGAWPQRTRHIRHCVNPLPTLTRLGWVRNGTRGARVRTSPIPSAGVPRASGPPEGTHTKVLSRKAPRSDDLQARSGSCPNTPLLGGAQRTHFITFFFPFDGFGREGERNGAKGPTDLTFARGSSYNSSGRSAAYLHASPMPPTCVLVVAGALERL